MSVYPRVGEQFGRYRVTGMLGRGGMGVVFSAVRQDLDRKVALKILSPELALQDDFRHRFSREATALAALYSPHIIDIYDHGEVDGCLFIATQLINGGDLGALLERHGGLPPAQALDVVAQVASALADAHEVGVIHRDLKPSNVLVRRSGEEELFAYLCDFGIAQTSDRDSTRTQGLIGTLAYMAPERHEGGKATVATDIYSLGCLLWAAVSGRPPYSGGDVQVAIQHLREPAPSLPGQDALPQAINAIVERCMAKRPEDRYPSATAVRAELRRAMGVATTHPVSVDAVHAPGPRRDPADSPSESATDLLPPVGGSRKRRSLGLRMGAAAVLVLMLAIAAVAFNAVRPEKAVTCPDGSVARTRSGCAAAITSRPVRCWDGTEADHPSTCSDPRGLAGLKWAFPSLRRDFGACRQRVHTVRESAPHSWFCPAGRAGKEGLGITYTEWSFPEAAQRFFDLQYPDPSDAFTVDGEVVGFRWMTRTPRRNGFYKLSLAYRDLPFSAAVHARSADDVEAVCAVLRVRSPQTFRSEPADCTRGP